MSSILQEKYTLAKLASLSAGTEKKKRNKSFPLKLRKHFPSGSFTYSIIIIIIISVIM